MINDLADKNSRKALIERYLEAETTPAEEQRLRDWFARHQADADEREIALLVGLAAPCASCLPELDETEAEFDRLLFTKIAPVKTNTAATTFCQVKRSMPK